MPGPWEKYGAQQGQVVSLPPDPMQQAAAAREEARLRIAQDAAARAAANAPSANERALREQLLAAQVQSAQANAEKARKGNAGSNIGDAKTQQRMANLTALQNQLRTVRGLWEKSLKGGVPNAISGRIPDAIRAENGAFESAAAGLGEIGLAAFRVPGVGSQSDAELRQFVNANTPLPSDSDAKIEQKLGNLQNRLDATLQAMGQAPAKQEEQAPPGPDGGQLTVEAGQYREPRLAGVEQQYRKMLAGGKAPGEILQFLRSQGINANPQDVVEQARYIKKNGPASIKDLDTSQIEMVWRDKVTRNTLGINPDSGLGAAGIAAANALTGGTLDEIVGLTGGDAEAAQIAKETVRQRNPGASLAGDIGGAALGMTGLNTGFRFLGGRLAPLATRAGGLGTDLIYGAGFGAGESNDDRLGGALTGAGSAAAGNLVGRGLVSGAGRSLRGVADPNVNYLNDRGITMSPGQVFGQSGVLGRGLRAVEDTLESVPFLGASIKARKAEGLEAFNREAFKDALAPIHQQVEGDLGQEAIGQAQDYVSGAYGDALSGVNLRPDGPFIRQTDDIIARGSDVPIMGDQFNYIMGQKIDPLFAPDMSGRNFQAALQTLSRAGADFPKQGIMGAEVAGPVREMKDAFIDLANRQAPGVTPALNAANAANRNVSILGDAVNATGGELATPLQLRRAAQSNTKKFGGKKAAARGDTPFADLYRAGEAVLPNQIPNSGTTDRALATLVLPAALGGSAAGSEAVGMPTPVTASLATLAALSTRRGNNLVQALALKRNPATRAIGEELLRQRRLAGMFGAGAAVPLLGN